MSKATAISKFTNSLIEYMLDALSDQYEGAQNLAYRFNNLKVYMDPMRVSQPHFFVSMGISEACFSIEDGRKLEGSLGHEDAYVQRWASRVNIQSELKIHWKALKDAIAAEHEEDAQKKERNRLRLRKLSNAADTANVDMTGTGIIRYKNKHHAKHHQQHKLGTDYIYYDEEGIPIEGVIDDLTDEE